MKPSSFLALFVQAAMLASASAGKDKSLSEGCKTWSFLNLGNVIVAKCWESKPGKSKLHCSKLDLNLCFGYLSGSPF
jgi:hypothetical protein